MMAAQMFKNYTDYRSWFDREFGGKPMYEPFTEDQFLQGYDTYRLKVAKRVFGLSPVESRYTLESWYALGVPNRDEIFASMNAWRDGAIRTLYLWSKDPGTGKTGFAAACAKDYAESYRGSTTFLRIPEFSLMPYAEQNEAIFNAGDTDCAVLDDAHRFKFSVPAQADVWHALCDRLLSSRTKLIVTANASFQALSASCGKDLAAAWDRIRAGGMDCIEVQGASLR